jgi:hypothetical protein
MVWTHNWALDRVGVVVVAGGTRARTEFPGTNTTLAGEQKDTRGGHEMIDGHPPTGRSTISSSDWSVK